MSARRAVITGLGIVNPCGIGKEAIWDSLIKGRAAIGKISRFNCDGYPVCLAAEIQGFNAQEFVPRRLLVKTDRFTHFALAASELALCDAKLDLSGEDPFRVGVWMGNNAGGWDICERGFRELYNDGPELGEPVASHGLVPYGTARLYDDSVRHQGL